MMMGVGATAFGDGGKNYTDFRDECISVAREGGAIVVSTEMMIFHLPRPSLKLFVLPL